MSTTPLSAPSVHPHRAKVPALLSVPHAGRDYPDWLLALSRGGRSVLHTLEDPHVDQLVERSIDAGIGVVIARAPRAAVDCNRAEEEIDPTVIDTGPLARVTPRAKGGLGIVPGRTASHGVLWRQPIRRDQLEERLEQAYRPFHRAIASQLSALYDRFGCALLIDCHSMPPLPRGAPAIIFGDRFGRSAAPWLTAEAVKIAGSAGYLVGVNEPFAGGHVLDMHGKPHRDIHALQIEIDRRCYLRDGLPERTDGFERIARLIEALAFRLGHSLIQRRYPQAAE